MNFEEIICPLVDEKYYKGTHSSGLEIIVIPKKQTTLYAMLATRYGSVDNSFKTREETEFHTVPEGVAHFLEHKLFENSNGEDTFLRFSALGASANAFTSNDVTSYLFTATENYYESLEELVKFVSDPYFTPETVEKEMGIIEQELRMYEDNPQRALYENMLSCLYESHPVKIPVGGTPETIRKITPEILYNCYNTFYNPCNMMLIACGDVEPEKVSKIVDKTLPSRPKVWVDKARYTEKKEVAKEYHEARFPVSLPLFRIGVKDPDISCEKNDALKRELEHTILLELLFGHGSEFFERLYDKGLINHKFGFSYQTAESFSHTSFAGESRNPKEVYELVKSEAQTWREKKLTISEEDFVRIKRMTWGMCAQVWNSTTDIGDAVLDYELINSNLSDLPAILSDITIDDIEKRLETSYRPEYFALSVVLPAEDKK